MRAVTCLSVLATALPAAAEEPQIQFVHRTPDSYPAGEEVVIEGNMLGGSEVESAELVYRTDALDGWRNIELDIVSGDHYRGEIPAEHMVPPKLEYYVRAIDFLEGRHDAAGSEAQPFVIEITGAPGSRRPGIETVSSAAEDEPEPEAEGDSEDKTKVRTTVLPEEAATFPERPAAGEPGVVSRLERAHIAALGAITLADVLQALPEIEVHRDERGFYRLGLRGMGRIGDVQVLLDGQRLNDPYDGSVLLTYPAALIESVSLRRGPAASVARPRGLAGAVEVLSRADPDPDFSVSAGTHASNRVDDGATRLGNYVATAQGGGSVADGVILRADGVFAFDDGSQLTVDRDAFSTLGSASDAPGPLGDDNMLLTLGGRAILDPLVPGELTLGLRYLYQAHDASIGLVDTYGPQSRSNQHFALVSAEYLVPLGEGRHMRSRLALDVTSHDRTYQLTPRQFATSDRDGDFAAERFLEGVIEQQGFTSFGATVDVEAQMQLADDNRLNSGIVVDLHSTGEPTLQRNMDPTGTSVLMTDVAQPPPLVDGLFRLTLAAFVEDTWAIHEIVDLVMGLRFTWVSDLDSMDASKALSPRVGLAVRPNDDLAIGLLYGSTFRPPTLDERSDRSAASLPAGLASGRYQGDPTLATVAAHTIELETEYDNAIGSLRYRLDASIYYQKVFDALASVPITGASDSITQRAEIDQIGLRAEARVGYTERTYLYGGLWWWRAWDTNPNDVTTLVTDEPQLGGILGLALEIGPWLDLNLLARYTGERRNNHRSVLERLRAYELPASVTLNARLETTELFETVRFGVTVNNVLDTDRRDPVARPDTLSGGVPREGMRIMFSGRFVL